LPFKSLENAVIKIFKKKGDEIAEVNINALRAGRKA
jgi:Pyruvate/2-oxoacid:ferredoxin oxidoreductase gamma subunit